MLSTVVSALFRSIFSRSPLPMSTNTGDANAALISDDYRRMQQELHKNPNYGVASVGYAPIVADLMRTVGATELLDYGAGKGRLGQTLRQQTQQQLTIHHYDPAIPEWSAPPKPCRFVASIDVLEHIEPHLIDNRRGRVHRAYRPCHQALGRWPQRAPYPGAACMVVAEVYVTF
jgi:hypothetical protein